jgi:hypothetical protein
MLSCVRKCLNWFIVTWRFMTLFFLLLKMIPVDTLPGMGEGG